MTDSNDMGHRTEIDLCEGAEKVACDLAEKVIFQALHVIQNQFGRQFSEEVYQALLAKIISQRVKNIGYDALHEASGILSELECEFFPDKVSEDELLMASLENIKPESYVQHAQTRKLKDYVLLEGMPS